jgi:hypothetical protein
MRRRNRWVKTLFWGTVLGIFALLLVVFSGVAVGAFEQRTFPVDQPVPFSHAFHAGGLGLSCRYCHPSVERAAYAGLPPPRPA